MALTHWWVRIFYYPLLISASLFDEYQTAATKQDNDDGDEYGGGRKIICIANAGKEGQEYEKLGIRHG